MLEETRTRWIQVQNHAEATLNKIRDIVNEGVYKAEEGLGRIWSILAGTQNKVKEHAGLWGLFGLQNGHRTHEE